MNTKKAYDDFYQLLSSTDEIKTDNNLFRIIQNYANARLKDLVGIDYPVHIYFEETYSIKRGDDFVEAKYRYNPLTKEVYNKNDWGKWNRAYFSKDEGVFIDFEISNNNYKNKLDGYKKIYRLVDFAFTLDHELQHIVQSNNMDKGIISFDNFRYVKDWIILNIIGKKADVVSRHFYFNAHNKLFLEKDANNQATKFVSEQINSRVLGKLIVYELNDKIFTISDVLKQRMDNAYLNNGDSEYTVNQQFGLNNFTEQLDLSCDPEKIIDLLIDSEIKRNPKGYLKKYPVLSYVYNSDGTKKTYYEIKKIIDNNPDLKDFYQKVTFSDPLLRIQKIEYFMVEEYCSAKDDKEKIDILDHGINKIKELIEKENIDINNILVYLEKGITDIEKLDTRSFKNISKFVFYVTKQAILQKELFKNAFVKSNRYKEDILNCQKILSQKCDIKFENASREKILEDLNILIGMLKVPFNYLAKKYTEEETKEFLNIATMYKKYLTNSGYILRDEENHSINREYDNLYDTAYYKEIILNNNSEDNVLLINDFEIINALYVEMQRMWRTSTPNEDLIMIEAPIIVKLLSENESILQTLYTMKNVEDNYLRKVRLNEIIMTCEEYLNTNNMKR